MMRLTRQEAERRHSFLVNLQDLFLRHFSATAKPLRAHCRYCLQLKDLRFA